MRQKYSALPTRVPAERLVRGIPRATRKRHSAEDRIRNVLEGAGSKESIENIGKWGPETFSFRFPFLRHFPLRKHALSPGWAWKFPSICGLFARNLDGAGAE